jgi:hypothetical protein
MATGWNSPCELGPHHLGYPQIASRWGASTVDYARKTTYPEVIHLTKNALIGHQATAKFCYRLALLTSCGTQ